MNEQEYLAKIICEYIGQNRPCVMASIISQSGSAPRHEGSKMVVDEEGRIYGTIGGSLLEATAIKKARSAIAERRSFLMNFSLNSPGTDSAGMICGGQAKVLLDYIAPTPENREFFQQMRDAFTGGRRSYLLTVYSTDEESVLSLKHSLITPDRKILGSTLSEVMVEAIKSKLHEISGTILLTMEDLKVIVDPIHPARTLYCLGAGHVAIPIARLAASVGFKVIVIDDRAEFASSDRFPEAAEVRVIEDFNRAFDPDSIDQDDFIAIFTRGHRYDKEVVEQALKTKAGYIGLMGSKKKRDAIYQALRENGFSDADLARVHCPIGIPLAAETPEELAVSIVGELINERARK